MKYEEIKKELELLGASDPQSEALIIIEGLFGVSGAQLLLDRERDFQGSELESVLNKRKEHIPLQHIFGEWEFMGKKFYVSPDCLIPRPDTEILVEKALEIMKNGGDVADLCTGSGCIGISMLLYGNVGEMTLMDISMPALEMARKNASLHGVMHRCNFVHGDITRDMIGKKFHMIVSNPPYIPTKDIESLSPEVKKEPILALDGGGDGLDIIRFLLGNGLSYLYDGGHMLIEFGYDQGEKMGALLREKCDTGLIKAYEILHDYGGNPRVAVIQK